MAGRRSWQRLATVRVRTTVVATVIVGLALAIGAVSLVLLLRRSQVSSLEDAAKVRATEIAGLAAAGRLPNPISGPIEDASLVQVVDDTGRVIAASENIVGEPRLTTFVPAGTTPALTTLRHLPIGEGGAAYRVVAIRVRSTEGPRVVYVAASLNAVDENLRQVGGILAAGLPVFLLLVGATTWVMVGRAFRPVERIRREVADVSAHDLSRRVPVPAADDEVGRLARTMNTMLERLQRATDRERAFVGDASHELRSPVAAMRAQLEVTRADPELLDEVLRMEGLIENLLLLARTDGRAAAESRAPLDFDDVVLAEVARARASATTSVRVGTFQPARVRGDGAELGRVVRNLLENAQRHATSSVVVDLRAVDGTVQLAVADDGRGIAPEDRERVFERFTRLDDARDRERGGAGLGLAIVRDVLRAHGGDAVVDDRPGGGARFVVTLPAAGTDG
jgi:signal transduction histidine kinase